MGQLSTVLGCKRSFSVFLSLQLCRGDGSHVQAEDGGGGWAGTRVRSVSASRRITGYWTQRHGQPSAVTSPRQRQAPAATSSVDIISIPPGLPGLMPWGFRIPNFMPTGAYINPF
jgi:hypothetical protein